MPKGLETVLVAEDETALRELASQSLRELGYHVLEAADGEEALRIMQERKDGPIDILLTDGKMPRMGGKQLAEHFRAFYPQAEVLYISGFPADGTTGEGHQAGAQSLPKPFSLTELSHKVRDMLDEVEVEQA
jgi:DNA-binding response OmpR family regulator